MRAKLAPRAGMLGATALALVVVMLYSLWGASILRAQRQAAVQDPASLLTANR